MDSSIIAQYRGQKVTIETSQPIIGVIDQIEGGYVQMSDCTVQEQGYARLLVPVDRVKAVLM